MTSIGRKRRWETKLPMINKYIDVLVFVGVFIGDICTSTSVDDIPRYRLHGDHINVGQAIVQLRRISNDSLLHQWTINTSSASVGGQFSLDTGSFVCNGQFSSYFRVYDSVSGRWSAPYYVKTICYVL